MDCHTEWLRAGVSTSPRQPRRHAAGITMLAAVEYFAGIALATGDVIPHFITPRYLRRHTLPAFLLSYELFCPSGMGDDLVTYNIQHHVFRRSLRKRGDFD